MKASNDILFYTGRHGQTAANDENIYRAWSNDPKAQLDDKGREQADEIGQFFVRNMIPIRYIITDDLDRTQETAKRVSKILGISQVYTTPQLRPLNMGDWTLKSKKDFPIEDYLKDPSKKIPGGEAVKDFDEREIDIFTRILQVAKATTDGFVLVICHGSNNSFLNNRLYNRDEKSLQVGYEGLVNPGGIVMATDSNLCPLTNVRKKEPLIQIAEKFTLPKNHEPGMRVPKGGSSCASCEYLGDDKKTCKNEYFIKWNGGDKLPAPADEYCSDWYQPDKKEEKLSVTKERSTGSSS